MKKYVVFILSLVLLYIGFQFLSGWVLTALYTPDISETNTNLSEESVYELSPIIQLLAILLIATLAYFFSQKLLITSNK